MMSYRTRIYNKPLEHAASPEAAPSLAEVLRKYTLESKATTPQSRCLLLSVSGWMRSPDLSFAVLSLSVLSVLLHRIQKDVL